MLPLEQALETILAAVRPGPVETVTLDEASGRFTAEAVPSPVDLQPFDNSSVDGYAVRCADLATASPASPVKLKLNGRAAAGEPAAGGVAPGACVRIFTGAVLPPGADAVAMQEDTRHDPSDPAGVLYLDTVQPGENVRRQAEDVRRGAELVPAGRRLPAAAVSLLAAAGIPHLAVHRKPVVGLLATGDELREPDAALEAGAIFESNRAGLAHMVRQAGGIARVFPIVRDDPAATEAALRLAFHKTDVVVSSGGVSVGETDYVRTAFGAMGGKLDFWSIAMRPGKPFAFGQHNGRLFFGLPGNPVSALVAFFLLVRPALLRWQGAADVAPPGHPVTLAEPLANAADRRHFLRVVVDGEGRARSAGRQASHVISALARADGLVDVPARTTLPAGAVVRVMRWD